MSLFDLYPTSDDAGMNINCIEFNAPAFNGPLNVGM